MPEIYTLLKTKDFFFFFFTYVTQKKVCKTKAHPLRKQTAEHTFSFTLHQHQGSFSSAIRILSGTAHTLSFRLIILRMVSSNKVSSKTEYILMLFKNRLDFLCKLNLPSQQAKL